MASAFASPQIATFISSTFQTKSHSQLSLRTKTLLSSTSILIIPSKKFILFHNPAQRNSRLRFILPSPAAAEDVISLEPNMVDTTEQLVTNSDDGLSMVVSSLFLAAFIGLSVITIGVIYLAVTDFLQKREKETFEKEAAANKSKKKKKVGRARAGPKGFGQKVVEYEDDD